MLEGVRAGPIGLCGLGVPPFKAGVDEYIVSSLPYVPFESLLPL